MQTGKWTSYCELKDQSPFHYIKEIDGVGQSTPSVDAFFIPAPVAPRFVAFSVPGPVNSWCQPPTTNQDQPRINLPCCADPELDPELGLAPE